MEGVSFDYKIHNGKNQMAYGKRRGEEDCQRVLAVGGKEDKLDSPLFLIHFLQFGQDDGIGGFCSIMKKHTIINGQVGDTLLFLHRPFI